MMKKLGCLVFVAGVLIFLGSFFLFGASVWRAMEARKVSSWEIKPGAPLVTNTMVVDTDKSCQMTVSATFNAKQVTEGRNPDKSVKYRPKYSFPFTCTVRTPDGGEILAVKKPLSSEGKPHFISEQGLTKAGGSGTARHTIPKFDVTPPGKVVIEATVESDSTTGAELIKTELVLYDNVARHGRSVGLGFVMLGGGILLVILGVLVFLMGMIFDTGRRTRRVR